MKPVELIAQSSLANICKHCKQVKGDKYACMLEDSYLLTYDGDCIECCTTEDYQTCPLNIL